MEKVHKKDLFIYNKNSNVATIKGAFGRFLTLPLLFATSGIVILFMSLNNIAKQYAENGVCNNYTLLIYSIVLLVASIAIIITRAIMLKDPKIYFIDNDMYIKESKDYYLKVERQEIDEYSWAPFASENYAGFGKGTKRYSSCSYWGNVNLVINGTTYTLSSSSLKKAKHYLEGFLNGVPVAENHFDGNPLRALYLRIYFATSIVVSLIIGFCYMMFDSVNSAVAIASIILFSASLLTGIILLIRFCVKFKDIRKIEKQQFEEFVVNSHVKLNESSECDMTQEDNLDSFDRY